MQKRYLPIVAFFALLLAILAHFTGRITAVPATFTHAEEKVVYLTFDDGPSTVVTGNILDTLKEEGVPATFFIVSDRVAGREEVLKRAFAEGHTLGVHSATHEYRKIYASDDALVKDIDACADVIERVTGAKPPVYRFPGGSFCHGARRRLVESKGYRIVDWNAVCGDEEIRGASAETLYRRAIETSQGKNSVVLLLHDSAPHAATAQALPAIIRELKRQGYTFLAF